MILSFTTTLYSLSEALNYLCRFLWHCCISIFSSFLTPFSNSLEGWCPPSRTMSLFDDASRCSDSVFTNNVCSKQAILSCGTSLSTILIVRERLRVTCTWVWEASYVLLLLAKVISLLLLALLKGFLQRSWLSCYNASSFCWLRLLHDFQIVPTTENVIWIEMPWWFWFCFANTIWNGPQSPCLYHL